MGTELSIERFIGERDELRQQSLNLKDNLLVAYEEAFRHYYENIGLSQENFYEGMCCGVETALREIGVDNEDIAQLQEAVREEVADAYAEKKFYEEHGYYPDEEVNK